MVKKRIISKEKYIIAATITVLIFLLGVVLGLLVDNLRADASEKDTKLQEINYNSLQLQYLFLSQLQEKEDTCSVMSIALQESIKQLSKSLGEVEEYSQNSHLPNDKFKLIQRRYILDNIRYWILASKNNELCKTDLLPILYFYSSKNCDICPDQGTTLTYFKKKFGDNILIFPIDNDLAEDEPMVSIISARYKVNKFPTLIISDEKYEGLVDKPSLDNIICQNIKSPELCKNQASG